AQEMNRMPLPPPPPPPPPAPLTPRQRALFDQLAQIENTSKALVLGDADAVIMEAPVKDLIDNMAKLEAPAKTLIFDGVVSQRLLDVAREKGIDTVVASRLGAVGKIPDGIQVFTQSDLAMTAASA
ncbi:MAG: hypothetical protein WCB18_05135, partial [Thermoplasmata archaeon]